MPDSSYTPSRTEPPAGGDRVTKALTGPGASPAPPPSWKESLLAQGKAMAFSAVLLAGLWVVAFLVLHFLFEYTGREAVGFACLAALVGAFFVKSFVPHFGEKARTAPSSTPQHTDSAREVVETVVFVVVLVLLLKSFAAEAFVIPTGSMAETLYGYQKIVPCPQCGIEFPVNCSSEVEGNDGVRAPVNGCYCPNCRYPIQFGGPKGLAKNPAPSSGDRVLVAKYVYDVPGSGPRRLDVVVFKFPGDTNNNKFPHESGPIKRHVPMNYIKRLVGLPGETIAIHRGKLYVLRDEHALSYPDVEKAAGDPSKLALLWQPDHMKRSDAPALERFKEGKFDIVRKAPEVLLAMMRLVYDNDFQAADLKGDDWQRWLPREDSGWSAADKTNHSFRHDPSDKMGWLRYRHVLRSEKGSEPQLITDFMGYNTWQAGGHNEPPGQNWASDLVVETTARVDQLQGKLVLELAKGPDRFQARFDLAGQQVALHRLTGGGESALTEAPAASPIKKPGTYRLRFANVDDRLTVWVDDKLLFKEGVEYEPAKNLAPRKENDLEPVSIGAQGAAVTVSKLKIFRDTYYTVDPREPDVKFNPADTATWTGLESAPVVTYYVQPDHYLCLGDNSPESSDGRTWGLVPRRLMLGKALLVYYPFSRAGRIR